MAFSRSSLESTQQENKRLQAEVTRLRRHLEEVNSRAADVEHHERLVRERKTILRRLIDDLHTASAATADQQSIVVQLREALRARQQKLSQLREQTRVTEYYIKENSAAANSRNASRLDENESSSRQGEGEDRSLAERDEHQGNDEEDCDDSSVSSDDELLVKEMEASIEMLVATTRELEEEDSTILDALQHVTLIGQ